MADTPFIGPSYPLASRPASVQRTVNMIPVPLEPGNERTGWVFKDVAGLSSVGTTAAPSQYVNCDLLVHFDDASSASWRDYSINRRSLSIVPYGTGSIVGGATGQFSGGGTFVQQIPGAGSGNLNQTTYMTAAGGIEFDADEFYMSAWVNCALLPDTSASRSSYSMADRRIGQYPNLAGWYFTIADVTGVGAAVPAFAAATSTDGGATITGGLAVQGGGSSPIAVSTWTHLAASRKNNAIGTADVRVFVNGSITSMTSIAANSTRIFRSPLPHTRIGAGSYSTALGSVATFQGFHGLMDELFIVHGPGTGIDTNFTPPTIPFNSTKTLRQILSLDP